MIIVLFFNNTFAEKNKTAISVMPIGPNLRAVNGEKSIARTNNTSVLFNFVLCFLFSAPVLLTFLIIFQHQLLKHPLVFNSVNDDQEISYSETLNIPFEIALLFSLFQIFTHKIIAHLFV